MRSFMQLIVIFCVVLGSAPVTLADYYKFTDQSGTVHMTNKLDSIPKKYPSSMKIIREESLSQRDPGARQQVQQPSPVPEESAAQKEPVAPESAPITQGKFAEFSARYVWFRPLVYVGAVFAGLLIVIKLAALVPSPMLSRLIYISFFVGVLVFLYKTYVDNLVANAQDVREKAVATFKKANVREAPLPGEAPAAERK